MLIDLARPVLDVAPALLGHVLRHKSDAGAVAVFITEVEAYDGESDPASHAFRGRTARNAVMFGPAGRLYVYRSHGLHWCANVVTGSEGRASAVLIRAGRLAEGFELARLRRGERVKERDLTRGPGRVCHALGLAAEQNGTNLLNGGEVTLSPGESVPVSLVECGPRVGVSRAHDRPWRFWVSGDPSVSGYKLSPRARR